ncbi:MAG: site-2 protease family protein [Candidatus Bathyarchaeia archaeon]
MGDPEVNSEEAEPGRFEFSFPLLTVRTKVFSGVFDKLGSFRFSRVLSWVALVIVPVVAAIGLYFLCSSLFTLLWTSTARDITRDLGLASYLLIPGINPLLPILYGWLAIVCAIVIHEGAHGVVARNRGLKVNSSGLLFFLVIPIGAFVDVDEEELTKTKPRDSLPVMAAGVGANAVVAVACILALILLVNGLTPVIDGVIVSDVAQGMPADVSGVLPNDIFVSIDGIPIQNYTVLSNMFENKTPGEIVQVTVARGKNWDQLFFTSINLTESDDGRAIMGVTLGDLLTAKRLSLYQNLSLDTFTLYLVPPALAPTLVPFSDTLIPFYTHPLGSQWHVFANVFYWLWFVNVNLAIFNALPIYPMDGGRIFDITLKKLLGQKISEKSLQNMTRAVTAAVVTVLLAIAIIPFIY